MSIKGIRYIAVKNHYKIIVVKTRVHAVLSTTFEVASECPKVVGDGARGLPRA
jgi:hypothetical protein